MITNYEQLLLNKRGQVHFINLNWKITEQIQFWSFKATEPEKSLISCWCVGIAAEYTYYEEEF